MLNNLPLKSIGKPSVHSLLKHSKNKLHIDYSWIGKWFHFVIQMISFRYSNKLKDLLTKNRILVRYTKTPAIPIGTIGIADGGVRSIHWTDHFNPCCWARPGTSSNFMICMKSLSTLTGTFNIQQKPNMEFGLKGGAALRVSKNFSKICKIQYIYKET